MWSTWWCGWPGRTRAGAISASAASWRSLGGESVGHVGPHHLAAPGPRTSAETTWGTELVDVPARAGGGHRGLRLSHRGDDRAESVVRLVLHRARVASGVARRSDDPPEWPLGDPAGSQPVPGD